MKKYTAKLTLTCNEGNKPIEFEFESTTHNLSLSHIEVELSNLRMSRARDVDELMQVNSSEALTVGSYSEEVEWFISQNLPLNEKIPIANLKEKFNNEVQNVDKRTFYKILDAYCSKLVLERNSKREFIWEGQKRLECIVLKKLKP